MNSRFIAALLSIIILLLPIFLYGQGGPGPPGPPDSVPLDPLSWLALAGGAAIGMKKYFNQKSRNV